MKGYTDWNTHETSPKVCEVKVMLSQGKKVKPVGKKVQMSKKVKIIMFCASMIKKRKGMNFREMH